MESSVLIRVLESEHFITVLMDLENPFSLIGCQNRENAVYTMAHVRNVPRTLNTLLLHPTWLLNDTKIIIW